MQRLHVFVDESGDEHLNIHSGASQKYVLSAVCVSERELGGFVSAANEVRRFYFQTGEMKSSKVADDFRRRKLILQRLSALKFWALSFVVSKDRLFATSGFRFAPSFLKYTAKRLCKHLPLVDEVRVHFDEKGRVKFKDEFKEYLAGQFDRPDLFRVMNFDHLNSKEHVGVQVADFIAGSISKWFSNRQASIDFGIEKVLREKVSILEWPTLRSEGSLPSQDQARFDEIVRRESYARAWSYLDSNLDSVEEDIVLRCVFLDWLISHAQFGEGDFLLADSVLNRIVVERGIQLDAQGLRNRVVGPLRDQDVLIASSARGYKIPDRLDDMRRYVDLCATQIPPAVSRLRRARDAIRLVTGGELDLLDGDGLAQLRAIADANSL